MKIDKKKWIAVLLAVALLLAVGIYFLFQAGQKDRSGWSKRAGVICYLDKNGRPLQGLQEIKGKHYYFLPDTGARATGWVWIGVDRYYFGENGAAYIGWQELAGQKYYFEKNGKMVQGLRTIDGASYYFKKNGMMGIGWQDVDGVPCYFDETGKAVTGWHTIDGKRYYFTDTGCAVTGRVEIDGVWHHFDEDGAIAAGWFEDETGKIYFNEQGNLAVGPVEIDGKWYYFDKDGRPVTGWVEQDGEKYYCQEDGEMAVGQVNIDGVNHFFTSKGKYVLLVNKKNPVPSDFQLDLVSYGGYQIDRNAKAPLEQMRKDCPYTTKIDNIFRSKEQQQLVWNNGVSNRMKQGMTKEEAKAETARWAMIPGHSEHQTGLAVDLFGGDEARKWMEEHCWEYGFIVRYPEGKADYTGIDYEYWHFRYVGKELALELKELGVCLEEYMQMLSE